MSLRHSLNRILLLAGLMLCGIVLWQVEREDMGVLRSVQIPWMAISLGIVAVLCCAVAAWRQFVQAVCGYRPGWTDALRQTGMVLSGKYIPGGVFGFLMRFSDDTRGSKEGLIAAGLIEQLVSFGMAVCVGALLYGTASLHFSAVLVLLAVLPLLAAATVAALVRLIGVSRFLRVRLPATTVTRTGPLIVGGYLQLCLQLTWAAVVFVLVRAMFDLQPKDAIAIAGAFGLSVGAGIAVFIAPGGIGVREAAMIALSSIWLETNEAVMLAAALRAISVALDAVAGLAAMMVRPKQEGETT